MTQAELAGDELSVSYVSLLEAGRRNPTPQTIAVLAQRLGCSPAQLVDDGDTPSERPGALNVRYGQLALVAGDHEQAGELFAAALASPELDPMLRTDARVGAARVLESRGHLAEAALAYEALVQEAIDAPRYLAALSVVISWCRCLWELGELDRVVEVGTSAMQELDRLQAWHSDTAVELLATVAGAYFERGDLGQAERLLREGLTRAEQMSSPRARAAVLWNASQIASERGRQREALDLAEEALSYFRLDSDSRSRARLLGQTGYLLLRQQPPRPLEAKAVLDEAMVILGDCGRGFDRGAVLTELSRASLMLGDTAAAREAAEQSLVELGDEANLERARARTALAAAVVAQGDRETATNMFEQAADELSELKASREAARAWVELGNVLADTGDPVAATRAYRRATSLLNINAAPSAAASGGQTAPARPTGGAHGVSAPTPIENSAQRREDSSA